MKYNHYNCKVLLLLLISLYIVDSHVTANNDIDQFSQQSKNFQDLISGNFKFKSSNQITDSTRRQLSPSGTHNATNGLVFKVMQYDEIGDCNDDVSGTVNIDASTGNCLETGDGSTSMYVTCSDDKSEYTLTTYTDSSCSQFSQRDENVATGNCTYISDSSVYQKAICVDESESESESDIMSDDDDDDHDNDEMNLFTYLSYPKFKFQPCRYPANYEYANENVGTCTCRNFEKDSSLCNATYVPTGCKWVESNDTNNRRLQESYESSYESSSSSETSTTSESRCDCSEMGGNFGEINYETCVDDMGCEWFKWEGIKNGMTTEYVEKQLYKNYRFNEQTSYDEVCSTPVYLEFVDSNAPEEVQLPNLDYKMNHTFTVGYISSVMLQSWGFCGRGKDPLNCGISSKICQDPNDFKPRKMLINHPILNINITCSDALWGAVYYSGGYDVNQAFDYMNMECDDYWPDNSFMTNKKLSQVYSSFEDCCEQKRISCKNTLCTSGKHKDIDGNCVWCPAGTYRSTTSNTGNNIPGFVKCLDCPVGTKCTFNGVASVCAAGSYQPFPQANNCFLCPNGTYSIPGASRCEVCAAGTASGEGSARCDPCGAGTYSIVGDVACRDCPPGTYSPGGGMTSCMPCLPGSYNDEYGASICKPCSTGWEMAAAGATNCTECANDGNDSSTTNSPSTNSTSTSSPSTSSTSRG